MTTSMQEHDTVQRGICRHEVGISSVLRCLVTQRLRIARAVRALALVELAEVALAAIAALAALVALAVAARAHGSCEVVVGPNSCARTIPASARAFGPTTASQAPTDLAMTAP